MPLYEYVCTSCGITTEVIQSYSDEPLKNCESCGGSLRKLLSTPAFQFKGTGWYASDYGKGTGTAARKEDSEGGGKPEGDKPSEGAKPPEAPSPGAAASGSGPPSGDGGKPSE